MSGSDSFASIRRMLELALSMSAVNCRRARSGPTTSRGETWSGSGRRSRSVWCSRLSPAITSGSHVTTSASHVRSKHLRVRLSDATIAGPSSATRYLAWYLTTGSV